MVGQQNVSGKRIPFHFDHRNKSVHTNYMLVIPSLGITEHKRGSKPQKEEDSQYGYYSNNRILVDLGAYPWPSCIS